VKKGKVLEKVFSGPGESIKFKETGGLGRKADREIRKIFSISQCRQEKIDLRASSYPTPSTIP